MLSDPAAAAWIAAGRPAGDIPTSQDAPCGRCGDPCPTVPSSRVVREKFTDLDSWPYGTRRLCPACAWIYTRPPTTQNSLHIATATAPGTVYEHPQPHTLAGLLTAPDGLTHTDAVIVVVAKRRHLLPTAQWAHLATDGLVLRWDHAYAARLAELCWLRSTLAATWPQLTRPAPPTQLLKSQPADTWTKILTAWERLQPWRSTPPLWAAARVLTRTPPQSPSPPRL